MKTPRLLAFDVNETLLDVSALSPRLQSAVGDEVTLGEWFGRMLHGSLVANHLGRYRPFSEVGVDALVWLAARKGLDLERSAASEVVAGMLELPAHPEVAAGLEALTSCGVRIVALTNGSPDAVAAQLSHAGLRPYFDRLLTVEAVGRFKPAPEVYLHAAAICDVAIDEMAMVAAHDWDIAGAQSVGAIGCFVSRQPWGLPYVEPQCSVDGIGEVAPALGLAPAPT